ncbi:hypothetical protein HU200_056289 [Digitaria exilis]|uniref:MATH domain-containing protein n=1 Tax=Digitaria exilis TaxID=1010633 RepID=A0A835E2V6_9POAL|nr:hypothetical protein HU200_056289 [Digitaria exilis]
MPWRWRWKARKLVNTAGVQKTLKECLRYIPDAIHATDFDTSAPTSVDDMDTTSAGISSDDVEVEDSSDNHMVAVFLELPSVDAEVRAYYNFRLLDHAAGSSSSVSTTTAVPMVFDTLDDGREENAYAWGTDEFMKRSELEASSYLLDDLLVVECDVTVIEEALVEVLEDNTVTSSSHHVEQVPSKDLSSSLGRLLEMKRSAFLEGRERECIEIEGIQPAVFKALLHFVYTDTLPAMEGLDGDEEKDFVKQSLVAAERYGMNRLKLICEDILGTGLQRPQFLELPDDTTWSSSSVITTPVPMVFDILDDGREENAYAWGMDEFMEWSELEARSYLQDDRLVVECEVTVIKDDMTRCHDRVKTTAS